MNHQIYHRVGIIDWDKMAEYNERRKQAHVTNNCAFCGEPLNDRRKIYCNLDHADKFWKECNYFIISWQTIRNQALERDGHKCVKCGKIDSLEVDHIIEIADGGPEFELSNLQTLCWNCHLLKTAKSNHDRAVNTKIKFIRSQHIPLM